MEEIIIDGVNVAGCEQRSDIHKELLADGAIKEFSNYCYISNDGCYGINCYYKQLKRLEQENAELKAYKDVNEDFKTAWKELKAENDRLNKILQEIKKIAETELSYDMVGNELRHYKNYEFIRPLIIAEEEWITDLM